MAKKHSILLTCCWMVVVDESRSTALQSSIQKFLHSWYSLHAKLPPTVTYQAQGQCRILCPTWTLRWHSNAGKQSSQIKSSLSGIGISCHTHGSNFVLCVFTTGAFGGLRTQVPTPLLSYLCERELFAFHHLCEKNWTILIKQTDHLVFLTLYVARR